MFSPNLKTYDSRAKIWLAASVLAVASFCYGCGWRGLWMEIPPYVGPGDVGADVTDLGGEDATTTGGDATTRETCTIGQAVSGGRCQDCPRGTSRPAGDDPTGADTSCTPITCERNQRVLDKSCVTCLPGTIRPAGDDASGDDTMCDAVLCGANERVSSNMCIACEEGQTREAGDDASGNDTLCVDDPCFVALGLMCDDFNEAYIKASNAEAGDTFGRSVALDGDTLVVGASGERSDDEGVNGRQSRNLLPGAGAAYVFVKDTSGAWRQQAYLKSANTREAAAFGSKVAIDGDTIVVGAPQEDVQTGAAYVFARTESTWRPQATLAGIGVFGFGLAIDGDTIVVGAPQNDFGEGAAYVFTRTGTAWAEQAKLEASNAGEFDGFGSSVALEGDTIVVGAQYEESDGTSPDDNSARRAGAAYVFTRTGTAWAEQAYLKATNANAGDEFGVMLALDGDTLAVGASGEASGGVAIGGGQDDNSVEGAGAVYIFTGSGDTWSQTAYIKATNPGRLDSFGAALSLDGTTLVIGAPGEDSAAFGFDANQQDNNARAAGAVYIFTGSGDTWSQTAYIKATNTDADDRFGESVALDGDTLVIGAATEDSPSQGIDGDQMSNDASATGAAYVRRISAP